MENKIKLITKEFEELVKAYSLYSQDKRMQNNDYTEISGSIALNRWKTESSALEKSLYSQIQWRMKTSWYPMHVGSGEPSLVGLGIISRNNDKPFWITAKWVIMGRNLGRRLFGRKLTVLTEELCRYNG